MIGSIPMENIFNNDWKIFGGFVASLRFSRWIFLSPAQVHAASSSAKVECIQLVLPGTTARVVKQSTLPAVLVSIGFIPACLTSSSILEPELTAPHYQHLDFWSPARYWRACLLALRFVFKSVRNSRAREAFYAFIMLWAKTPSQEHCIAAFHCYFLRAFLVSHIPAFSK
uniref:Uncharacterized protein n=1 Tax=Rhipicephalus zambeziensis TaxID=60191 RepID=A0A224YG87_9ACAR